MAAAVIRGQHPHPVRKQLQFDVENKKVKLGQILVRGGVLPIEKFWQIIQLQGRFRCGECQDPMEKPSFKEFSIICEKCGKTALTIDEY